MTTTNPYYKTSLRCTQCHCVVMVPRLKGYTKASAMRHAYADHVQAIHVGSRNDWRVGSR